MKIHHGAIFQPFISCNFDPYDLQNENGINLFILEPQRMIIVVIVYSDNESINQIKNWLHIR